MIKFKNYQFETKLPVRYGNRLYSQQSIEWWTRSLPTIKLRHCNSQWHQFSESLWVRAAMDSLQNEANDEIYGIDAFYDNYIFTFSYPEVSWPPAP